MTWRQIPSARTKTGSSTAWKISTIWGIGYKFELLQ